MIVLLKHFVLRVFMSKIFNVQLAYQLDIDRHFVKDCPNNVSQYDNAAKRFGDCKGGQYHCLRTENGFLVELCKRRERFSSGGK